MLPRKGKCPGCRTEVEWGQVIRSCYARQDEEQAEKARQVKTAEKEAKESERAAKRAATAAGKRKKGRRKDVEAENIEEQDGFGGIMSVSEED